MRKFTSYFYSLLLTALFLLPWSGIKADELPVADGTETNRYVPFYGYYNDSYQRTQIIYPASELSGLTEGMKISALTFYPSTKASAIHSSNYQVSIACVEETILSVTSGYWSSTASFNTATTTEVYVGQLDATGDEMTITFTDEFEYTGGSILLNIQTYGTKGSGCPDTYFYGKAASEGASGYGTNYSGVSSISSATPTSFLPKVLITYSSGAPVTCAKPTDLAYSEVSASSAKITWTTAAASSNLQYKAGSADWVTVENITSPYVLSTTPNTAYQVKVQAVCGGTDGESSYTSAISFNTPCGAYTLPFTDDFSAENACWTRESCHSSSVVTGGTFLFDYHGTPPQYFISPEFVATSNEVKVEFEYWARGSYSETFQVGYSSIGNDVANDFTWDDVITYNSSTHANYSKTFPAGVAYVAIKYTADDQYGLYIDNFSVSEYIAPTCFVPTGLSASGETANSALLSWTVGKAGDDAWVVEYSTASDFSGSTELPATTNSAFPLGSLNPQTTYYVRVKTNCGANGYSDYSDAISLKTACGAQTIPFEEDFSGSIDCWKPVDCHEQTGVVSGEFKFRYTTTPPQYLITPELVASSTAVQVEFSYRASNSMFPESFKVGYSTTTNDLSAFTWGTEVTNITASDNYTETLPAGVKYVAIQCTSDDKSALFIDDFSVSEAPSCIKPTALSDATDITPEGATFTWNAGGSETQYDYCVVASGAAADGWVTLGTDVRTVTITGKAANTNYDFYVRSNCGGDQSDGVKKSFKTAAVTAPTNVNVGSITTTGATATWTAAAGITTYQYCVVTSGSTATWDKSVDDVTVALSGLNASTTYDFYVRSYYAGNGATAAAEKVTFTTACEAITVTSTYTENFDGISSGIPACWSNEEGSTTNANYKWNYFATGQSGHCVRFESKNNGTGKTNVLASPVFDLKADADLTFYVKNKKGGDYTVEISVDGAARVALPGIGNLKNISDWTKQEVSLGDYKNHTVQFFFCGTSNWSESNDGYLYLDEFQIVAQSCRKPASDPVASGISSNGATLTWTAGGSNTDYQFSLVGAGETPVWDDANVVNALTKTFDNLEPVHSYDFYVRTYCAAGDGNQSEARMVNFHTGCGVFALPYEENFTGLTDMTNPECWANTEGTVANDYQRWRSRGNNSMQFNSSTTDNGATSILATPTIQLGEGNVLSFWTKNPTGGDFKVQIEGEGIAREDLLTNLTGIADWTLKYAAIPAKFNNKQVQFFFCATSNEGDMNAYIYIDNVRVARGEIFEDVVDAASQSRLETLVSAAETLDVITTRPMQFNGNYNTLCLPFDLSAAQLAEEDCPLNNCELKIFDYADEDNGELVISITGASSIAAGAPYFFRYMGAAESDRLAVLYKDVIITASTAGSKTDVDDPVTYKGVFQTETLTAEIDGQNHNVFFLSANNTLYWPAVDYTANAFRAYFYIYPSTVSSIKKGMPLRFTESPRVPTGVGSPITNDQLPIRKVLEDNQVVIIRNGVKYTIQGQKIQ